ncbi:MAG: ubiquinone biosynthesis protein UbiJ [Oleiphilaceae bacterium]|jgi:ubiquinone biosynthesis protein UbiJ
MISPSIDSALCASIESSINALLKHDPALLQALVKFEGKRIRIQSDDWLILVVTIHSHGFHLSLCDDDECNATIFGSISELMAVALASDKADALMNGDVDISGSSALVLDLAKIVQQLDIDWEALISPMTGGVVAHQIGKGFRNFIQWGKDSSQILATNSKEYLEDEVQLLVPKPMAEDFGQQVSDLRLATDRAEARLAAIKQLIIKRNQPKEQGS